jgi:hypothetical protein
MTKSITTSDDGGWGRASCPPALTGACLTTKAGETPAPRRRHVVRLALAATIICLAGRFVYTRLFVMPPLASGEWDHDVGLVRPPADVDRTAEMVAAIKRVAPTPTVALPLNAPYADCYVASEWKKTRRDPMRGRAPLGTSMTLNPLDAVKGEWAPSKRFLQGQIAAYLDRPEVRQALEKIASLADEPFCLTAKDGMCDMRPYGYAAIYNPPFIVGPLFAVRARRHMAEERDLDKALEDVKAAIRLSAPRRYPRQYDRLTHSGRFYLWPAIHEVANWSSEYRLSPATLREFARWLIKVPCDWRQEWRLGLAGERMWIEQVLDQAFTKDRSGDGWFVYYREKTHPVLRVLNLLSPLFDGRRATARRIEWQFNRLMSLADRPITDSIPTLKAAWKIGSAGPVPTNKNLPPLPAESGAYWCCQEGWAESGLYASYYRYYIWSVQSRVWLDTAAILLSVSAYQAEHGAVPADLSMLVPRYLDAVPIDPFSREPYRYRPDKKRGFIVYSVGPDGFDDGGTRGAGMAENEPYWVHGDWVFYIPKEREEPFVEWQTAPGPATSRKAGNERRK